MSAKPDHTGISTAESYPVNLYFGSNTIHRTKKAGYLRVSSYLLHLTDASAQLFQVERYEGSCANPPKSVTARPRIIDLHPSASAEDGDASEPPIVAARLNSQLPTLDGCAARTIWFEQ